MPRRTAVPISSASSIARCRTCNASNIGQIMPGTASVPSKTPGSPGVFCCRFGSSFSPWPLSRGGHDYGYAVGLVECRARRFPLHFDATGGPTFQLRAQFPPDRLFVPGIRLIAGWIDLQVKRFAPPARACRLIDDAYPCAHRHLPDQIGDTFRSEEHT